MKNNEKNGGSPSPCFYILSSPSELFLMPYRDGAHVLLMDEHLSIS